ALTRRRRQASSGKPQATSHKCDKQEKPRYSIAVRGFCLLPQLDVLPSGAVVDLFQLFGNQILAGQILGHQQTVRHVDGRVGADDHTDDQRQGKAVQRLAADQQQRQQYHDSGSRGCQGTGQGLGSGDVDHLGQIGVAHQPHVLPHPVEYHDGVVQRVAHPGQQCRKHRQVEGNVEERQDTQGEDGVVQQRHHRIGGELQLETHRHVQQDAAKGQQQTDTALITQFLTDLRADELHPLDGNFLGRVVGADQLGNPAAHVGVITGQTDHDVRGRAEVLDDGIAQTSSLQRLADAAQIDRLAVAQLDLCPPGEVQTEVQPLDDQAGDGGQTEYQCDDVERLAPAHEVDGVVKHLLGSSQPDLAERFTGATTQQQVDQRSGHQNGTEQRGDNTQRQRDGEALDRAGGHGEQDGADQQRGQVTVENGGKGLVEALVNGPLRRGAVLQLLAYSREDQHVGVNGHTQSQYDTSDARQGQG